jgi:hypothetical protein
MGVEHRVYPSLLYPDFGPSIRDQMAEFGNLQLARVFFPVEWILGHPPQCRVRRTAREKSKLPFCPALFSKAVL